MKIFPSDGSANDPLPAGRQKEQAAAVRQVVSPLRFNPFDVDEEFRRAINVAAQKISRSTHGPGVTQTKGLK